MDKLTGYQLQMLARAADQTSCYVPWNVAEQPVFLGYVTNPTAHSPFSLTKITITAAGRAALADLLAEEETV